MKESTNVASTWDGWKILLEAKKKVKPRVGNSISSPPVGRIESISNTGVVIVKFSKPMVMLNDLSMLFGDLV